MPVIRLAKGHRRKASKTQLNAARRSVHSQGGEDGVIEKIFEIIGTKNKWCVEFGAWDGVYLSNTCRLIREEGWSAVLIEGSEDRCEEIRTNHPDEKRVIAAHRWVGFDRGENTIDDILKATPIPHDFDLISIDVDGIDWHIWESIVEYRPRVVVIEFNPTVPNAVVFVQDRDMQINEGCSIAALVELGKEKGYELICIENGNGFFVVKEEFESFGIEDNSIDALRADCSGYIWHGYNGKIYHTMPRLGWWGRNVPLRPDSLQLLNEFWFHGQFQGRSDESVLRTAEGKEDLETADGIVRELQYLRTHRREMDEGEWRERSHAAWKAAGAWSTLKREWEDATE